MKRRLLFLACRHHFARLKSQWHFIDKSKFDPLDSDEAGDSCLNSSEKAWLASRQAAVISNLQQHLEDVQPCEDYREFAQLKLQLLGEKLAPAFLHLGLITEQGGWQKAFTASNICISPSVCTQQTRAELSVCLLLRSMRASGLQHL